MQLDPADSDLNVATESSALQPTPFAAILLPGLEVLAERLEDYARATAGAFATNTVRALAADSRMFASWCAAGRTMLPATSDTVVAFIDAQVEIKSRATVERYRSSVTALHRAAGLPNPCADEIVRLAVKRMTRSKGHRQKQAEPLNRPSIDRMLSLKMPGRLHRRVTEVKRETPLIALLRRSDFVSLYIEDLDCAADGSGTVLVRRSKADQEGEGAIKYLAPHTVANVEVWLAAAGLTAGPLLRPLTKAGRPGQAALGGAEVSRVFRDVAAAAGLKMPRLPLGHSTRVGATQDMFAAGFELLKVMRAGSWKTSAMPARYGERLRAQRSAARKLPNLQNRVWGRE